MRRNILAIDQATKSGYSIYTNGKITKGNVLDLKKALNKHLCFHDTISTLIEENEITEIVAEDLYNRYSKAVLSLGELRGILKYIAAIKGIPITFVEPKEHKYHLTGNEYSSKGDTMEAIKELGYHFKDDNQADSISIMLYYLNRNHLPIKHPIEE